MLPKGANLQKIRDGKRTYAITPHLPGGFIKPDVMQKYVDVTKKYGGTMKLTSAQRIMITGLKAEDIEDIWQELGMTPALGFANCVRSVKICPGNAFCKRGKQDSIKLGLELNSCGESVVKDVGVIGTDAGWDVYVGGSAGSHPRLANRLIEGLDYEDTLRIVDIIMRYYQKHADIERIGQFIDRIGFEKFKSDVLAEFYGEKSSASEPKVAQSEAGEKIVPLPGGLTEGDLVFGDPITGGSVISDIIRVYPQTVPVFRSFGMGCLGCPSSAGEPVIQAAEIHGLNLTELLAALNKVVPAKVNS
ncbi:MAG: hypothetical protein K0R22_2268 [Sporomusa sp.]|nr:hypothetical protein [Sporomusa sp.]